MCSSVHLCCGAPSKNRKHLLWIYAVIIKKCQPEICSSLRDNNYLITQSSSSLQKLNVCIQRGNVAAGEVRKLGASEGRVSFSAHFSIWEKQIIRCSTPPSLSGDVPPCHAAITHQHHQKVVHMYSRLAAPIAVSHGNIYPVVTT